MSRRRLDFNDLTEEAQRELDEMSPREAARILRELEARIGRVEAELDAIVSTMRDVKRKE